MQISRLLQMTYILLEKGTVTAPELAERFEVSVRTVYRDVEALSQAGIPVYTSQGKGGGISLSDRFVLNKSLLSDKEQDEILFALQSLSAARLPDLGEVFSKLSSLFRKNSTSWIEVDFSPWGSGNKQKELYTLLKQAILEQRVISFTYLSAVGEHNSRRAVPVKLLFKDRAWYVEAYSFERGAPRTFKITRMSNVQLLEGEGTGLLEFKQVRTASAGTSDEEIKVNESPRIRLALKIEPAGAYRIVDEFKEEEILKQEDGSFQLISDMPSGEWLVQYLLSYGDLLEVMEPESLRLEMKTRTAKMAQKYSG
ncbi:MULTISPECIES: YafY family protein [unclassified Paenibacillus]|uniref:helix-turn-helix transcriptional regulator n=1 Tax=unclassified Paenibacillus TaxID=185978 RepID=UPI002406A6D2|nr:MULTISPECIES: YafY family protein [unclassified Paenibacillus]MDF9841278.1 putative DNA-binding transcriptional regulator YafY [Paenibacillus sp. PastF-2]MDF9847869.1 putative DNA-binding transcriptional regulator YafY [Paenibacillus sp. PastM-2]MDF9854437.1 putative DNA-binding transcriptional regulator YafY [Paenibacillus sp. PastF-1]MDH6479954.1 putative DNA-binding transcriptional regulator YafY [Paenibacillus sp. PastH-2]MDH6507144.1 putative DNA-binding transcriptional regulator YafY 